MKRKLIIMLVTVLLILTNAVVVFAETTAELTVKTDKSEVKAGDTFTVTIGSVCKDGIGVLNAKYTYDSKNLELISQNLVNQSFMDLNAGLDVKGDIAVMGNSKIESADLYALTFKVKEGVESGTSLKINFVETRIVPFDVDTELVLPAQEITVEVKEKNVCDQHTPGEYLNYGAEGSHQVICAVCGEEYPEERHKYVDGVCVCGEKEKCEHTYGEYKDDGNGLHSATCTKCGEKHTAKHEYKDGVCSVCKAKEAVKDDTAANEKIPQAGLNIMLGFGVVAIAIIGIIMYRKNKQYKDIR